MASLPGMQAPGPSPSSTLPGSGPAGLDKAATGLWFRLRNCGPCRGVGPGTQPAGRAGSNRAGRPPSHLGQPQVLEGFWVQPGGEPQAAPALGDDCTCVSGPAFPRTGLSRGVIAGEAPWVRIHGERCVSSWWASPVRPRTVATGPAARHRGAEGQGSTLAASRSLWSGDWQGNPRALPFPSLPLGAGHVHHPSAGCWARAAV